MPRTRLPRRILPRAFPAGRLPAALLTTLLLAACGPTPPLEQIASGGKSISSWAATGEMVGRKWLTGDVPSAYAHKTLKSAGSQVEMARTSLEKSGSGAPLVRDAMERYGQLSDLLSGMADAVQRSDRGDFTRLLARLPDAGESVQSLTDRAKRSR